ncbi:helix-turn-helix domain-containing protein [Flavobacteriaceae bacterium 3-367]
MENLFNALVYFGFFQGLFFLGVLLFGKPYRKQVNTYLIFIISIIIVSLLGRVLLLLGIFGYPPKLMLISEVPMMLFGPSIALFVRSSLYRIPFKKIDLLHFIPAAVHVSYLFIYFVLASEEELNERAVSGELLNIVLVLGVIALLVNLLYLIWSWVLLDGFKRNMNDELSFLVKTRFLKVFLTAIGCCLVLWAAIILITFMEYRLLARLVYNTVWLCHTFIILFLGFYTFTRPEVFGLNIGAPTHKYAKSKLKQEDIALLKQELEGIMQTKKPYLNQKLLKVELAELLQITGPEMARILNEGFGMNFFEFTNYYRIKEFIALVESGQHKNLTFMAIAEKSGFNSKSTFNKAFKDLMGKTPRQYFS